MRAHRRQSCPDAAQVRPDLPIPGASLLIDHRCSIAIAVESDGLDGWVVGSPSGGGGCTEQSQDGRKRPTGTSQVWRAPLLDISREERHRERLRIARPGRDLFKSARIECSVRATCRRSRCTADLAVESSTRPVRRGVHRRA
jgi:hypothetical protein